MDSEVLNMGSRGRNIEKNLGKKLVVVSAATQEGAARQCAKLLVPALDLVK